MVDFYRLLQDGYPRAEALGEAQLRLRARHTSASSWVAFICQGDYGPHLPGGSE
jgi:CHAT domain-containing protein